MILSSVNSQLLITHQIIARDRGVAVASVAHELVQGTGTQLLVRRCVAS